jgi:hypothetical protein
MPDGKERFRRERFMCIPFYVHVTTMLMVPITELACCGGKVYKCTICGYNARWNWWHAFFLISLLL